MFIGVCSSPSTADAMPSRAKTLESVSERERDLAKKMLKLWQVDPDLAGLREPSALAKLSADERKECLALWNEVEGLLKRSQKTN